MTSPDSHHNLHKSATLATTPYLAHLSVQMASNPLVVKFELDITRMIGLEPFHHVLITDRSASDGVARQYRLDAETDRLDCLGGAPSGQREQVETDDPVRIHMRVHWDFSFC